MKAVRINMLTFPCFDRRTAYLLMTAVLGLTLAICLVNYRLYRNLAGEIAIYRNRISAQDAKKTAPADKAETEPGKDEMRSSEKRIDFVNNIIIKDIFPWERILNALEKDMPENVYLLSLAPDRSFRRIMIKGYADSMSEVSIYLREKEENDLFEQIVPQMLNVGRDGNPDAEADMQKAVGKNGRPLVEFELEGTLRFRVVFPENEYGEFWKKWEASSDKS